ncbi:hypothetical protein [Microvirga pudoricolor]|uniref:hypothetical protein n=1 Tax=Microvirga pudoricolor TaxID=2778729 RepID=UPI00195016D7|nr:hypothetical protein [Microvirga pudoricolor]MBM6593344.1 hypothetical protein [Microvirga pudoricolor]
MIAYMRMGRGSSAGGTIPAFLKLAVAASLGLAMLALFFVAFVVVFPVVLAVGAGFYFYLRHKIRQAQKQAPQRTPRPDDGIIDVEYTVVEHKHLDRQP